MFDESLQRADPITAKDESEPGLEAVLDDPGESNELVEDAVLAEEEAFQRPGILLERLHVREANLRAFEFSGDPVADGKRFLEVTFRRLYFEQIEHLPGAVQASGLHTLLTMIHDNRRDWVDRSLEELDSLGKEPDWILNIADLECDVLRRILDTWHAQIDTVSVAESVGTYLDEIDTFDDQVSDWKRMVEERSANDQEKFLLSHSSSFEEIGTIQQHLAFARGELQNSLNRLNGIDQPDHVANESDSRMLVPAQAFGSYISMLMDEIRERMVDVERHESTGSGK